MYTVFADGIKIFDDQLVTNDCLLINPKLSLSDSAAGSLSFTLPTCNIGYSTVQRLTSDIVVKRYDKIIWAGRVLSEDVNWQNQRKIYAEGELAFLCDSIQPPAEYHNYSIARWLETLIDVHNNQVEERKRFYIGTVQVSDDINDNLYRYTNFETTLDCINDKLLDRLGGHLRIRHEGDRRYLDYLSDYPRVCKQTINFGENLLDFTKSFDLSSLCTVVIPRGESLEESPIEALTAYLTVESVNDGSIYVVNDELVAKYGYIVKVVDWEDVTKPENLLKKAKQYLTDTQYEEMVLEISAADLSYMWGEDYDIDLLDRVRCVSKPHGVDKYFPVTKLSISLDDPANATITLGDTVTTSLTSSTNAKTASVSNQVTEVEKSTNQKIQNVSKTKQDVLTAGTNIEISNDGVISSTAGIKYEEGENITLSKIDDRTYQISAKDTNTTYQGGSYISIDGTNNINFTGNVIYLKEMTNAEYEALSEEERNNPSVIYFLPDMDLEYDLVDDAGDEIIDSDGNNIIGRI